MKDQQWTHYDKSKWGPGPWVSEPDKEQWTDPAPPKLIGSRPKKAKPIRALVLDIQAARQKLQEMEGNFDRLIEENSPAASLPNPAKLALSEKSNKPKRQRPRGEARNLVLATLSFSRGVALADMVKASGLSYSRTILVLSTLRAEKAVVRISKGVYKRSATARQGKSSKKMATS